MSPTTKDRIALSQDPFENRVERLRVQLGCLGKERDAKGSRFWYLRLGKDESELADTRPIAVAFDDRLDELSESEIKEFLTAKNSEIYAHYLNRLSEQQPVMYLLYPSSQESGRVAFVLPQEGGLKQRDIQIFELGSDALHTRLERLKQVPIGQNILCSVPLVDRVFYEPIKTAKELAKELAAAARQIEGIIPDRYRQEAEDGYLHQLLESFRRELLPNLKVRADKEQDYSFADIYAQTVAYALFTARVFAHVKDRQREVHFDRLSAWKYLPETNPFLRKLFEDISNRKLEELGDELIGAIADIFLILRKAQMETILQDFDHKNNREDIVIRFYEDFLNAYKPKMQKMRGVYYTPEPVVSYMVRSVDVLLKDKFNKPLGLADPEVMILDPATGTGTFLLWICQLIHDRFHNDRAATIARVGDISWSEYVSNHLLPRIFGFELLMAPYAIAHLKLGLFLQETGYQFDEGKRLGVYLTNTLDDTTKKSEFLLDEFIAEEASQATEIKRELPIMVAIGNPPYAANSANNGDWVANLVRNSYYPKDEIKESNPKLLLDDYVKFIRFAQWRIEKTGYGILSFVTNHGYLDNPTFRGMRQSLMKTFDRIYTIDLHGNTKKKEQAPDGSKDENVFDIQQGVGIGMFARVPAIGKDFERCTEIYHNHLFGNRDVKYAYLNEHHINKTAWQTLNPQKPFSLFIPQNTDLLPEYEQGWKVTDIFPVNSTGVKTHRDHFVLDFDRVPLEQRISDFRDLTISDDRIASSYDIKDTRDWKIKDRRHSLANESNWEQHFTKCLYRPFDFREYYHHADVVELPRQQVMQHLLEENISLMWIRPLAPSYDFSVLAGNKIPHQCAVGDKNAGAGASYLAPLYLHPTTQSEKDMGITCTPNLFPEFLTKIEQNLGYLPTPEAIFHYIYAIFHSPTYRSRYAEFLKIDFPRVPLTSDDTLFRRLGELGAELVDLHLMKSPILNEISSPFIENGGGGIIQHPPKYEDGKVVINKKKDGFIDVPEAVWNFHVGGYQVCHKWLKDRKGRTLSPDDIQHYEKIVVALRETIRVMGAIDDVIPGFPIQ